MDSINLFFNIGKKLHQTYTGVCQNPKEVIYTLKKPEKS